MNKGIHALLAAACLIFTTPTCFADDHGATVVPVNQESSSMRLTGQVSVQKKKSHETLSIHQSGEGQIYKSCKIRKDKSGFRDIELTGPGGDNWGLVVNNAGIMPLTSDTLRIKRQ